MNKDIKAYNQKQTAHYKAVCVKLAQKIEAGLKTKESKIWHGSPVWFLEGNPVVGYSVRKNGVQLLFWSGQSFKEPGLKVEGSFKAAQVYYNSADDVKSGDLKRWLKKAKTVQWDYKNIVKRRGKLVMVNDDKKLKDGAKCKVIAGTHIGKTGIVQDTHKSKTGHITITVVQKNGTRFKTLAKNVEIV